MQKARRQPFDIGQRVSRVATAKRAGREVKGAMLIRTPAMPSHVTTVSLRVSKKEEAIS